MSNNGKVKVYKNPHRIVGEKYTPYVPQYKIRGVEPIQHKKIDTQAYSSQNMESNAEELIDDRATSYSEHYYVESGDANSINEESNIFDDLTDVALDLPMIDNNDYMDESIYDNGLPRILPPNKEELQYAEEIDYSLTDVLYNMDGDTYLLMIDGDIVDSGTQEYIQNVIESIVFNNSESISLDSILVVKKIKIKVGLFLS